MRNSLLFILSGLIILSSCIKDEGNYDYNYLGTVTVQNMPERESIVNVKQGETLQFIPRIETDIPIDEFSYVWYFERWEGRDTISLERNLKVLADFDGGRLYFEIKHDKSNVRWLNQIYVDVLLPYQLGWAVLTTEGTKTYFNFFEQNSLFNYTYFLKLYTEINGESLAPDGEEVRYFDKDESWIVRSASAFSLINTEGITLRNSSSKMFVEPLEEPVSIPYMGFNNSEGGFRYRTLVANKKLYAVPYVNSVNISSDYMFDRPAEGDYELDHQVASIGTKQVLGFDHKYRRYVTFIIRTGIINAVVPTIDNNSLAFDPGNLNKDCIWMMNKQFGTADGRIPVFSILKDDTDNYQLQIFTALDSKITLQKEVDIPSSVINENTSISFDNVSGDIYFYDSNQVHLYNSANNTFTENWKTFESKVLAITKEDDLMAVATQAGNNSRFRVFKGDKLELISELVAGEIVSMGLKNR